MSPQISEAVLFSVGVARNILYILIVGFPEASCVTFGLIQESIFYFWLIFRQICTELQLNFLLS